jgi:glycosyltransferase involved in cell wall biosynthesis
MDNKKKLAVIGTVGLPAKYGGFETLADHLVRNMGDQYDITVYCSGKAYPASQRKTHYRNARLRYLPLKANGIQSIPYDTISILHAMFYADVLLILGVAGAWVLPFVKLFTRKKIIISIDGIEWKRDKWNVLAKCYLWWAEKIAVKYSHIDISDNESIQDYTALRYGSLSRIVEYGADHTMKAIPTENDKAEFPFLRIPYAFKVCRIEPENNVHEVLKAFSTLPKYYFVIVGNWSNSEYGRNLRKKYTSCSNILMLDPIYDQRKLDVLRSNALLYIHGHSAGGTNPSLVEAMYLGLPVIAFDVSYNKTTTENKAIYFTDAASLAEIITITGVDQLKRLGCIMGEVAKRRYTWKIISEKYNALIRETLSKSHKAEVAPVLSKLEQVVLLQNNAFHLKNQHLFYEKN